MRARAFFSLTFAVYNNYNTCVSDYLKKILNIFLTSSKILLNEDFITFPTKKISLTFLN